MPHAYQSCQQQALGLFIKHMVLDTLSPGAEIQAESQLWGVGWQGDL